MFVASPFCLILYAPCVSHAASIIKQPANSGSLAPPSIAPSLRSSAIPSSAASPLQSKNNKAVNVTLLFLSYEHSTTPSGPHIAPRSSGGRNRRVAQRTERWRGGASEQETNINNIHTIIHTIIHIIHIIHTIHIIHIIIRTEYE